MERLGLPVETRYFRSDQHTVNGLTAYRLETANSTVLSSVAATDQPYWGIRVWKRSADGVETEVTGGAPVAVVYGMEGLWSSSWNCPGASLNPTDSIVVRIYSSASATGPWTLRRTWTTGQLGAQSLDASTWTVYYYFHIEEALIDYLAVAFYFQHGDAAHPSRIENFTWTPAPPPIAKIAYTDGLVCVLTAMLQRFPPKPLPKCIRYPSFPSKCSGLRLQPR